MRWVGVFVVAVLAGCSTTRELTISARPEDAQIAIDGVNRGVGPIRAKLKFKSDEQIHQISASRLGYAPQTLDVQRTYDQPELRIELQPQTRRVTFHVTPVPAVVMVDGAPVNEHPERELTVTLPFTVDAEDHWTEHVVRVSHPGYEPAEQRVRWEDVTREYTLALGAMRKDLTITTAPTAAEVFLNGKSLGRSPISYTGYSFPVDPATGAFLPQKLKVTKAGYDPVERSITWDNGRRDYHIDLVPKTKTVHILTDPSGATVTIDGMELPRDQSGLTVATLAFPPINEAGQLRTYDAVISKKTADSEWTPEQMTIGWDEGKQEYSVALKEIKTRPVTLLRAKPVRTDEGWQIVPETISTLAMKDVTEGPAAEPPVRILEAPRGTTLDGVALSPDGQWLLYTILNSKGKGEFRSQIQMVKADGSGGPQMLGDDRSLNLTPTFTPDGSQVVFSSNRGGRHMSIWQMSASGDGGVSQLTAGDSSDLWPTVDSDPKPRLYYEALVDSRSDPRIYMTQLGTTIRVDLTQAGGEQPRVSPKADAVLFTQVNEKSGKRDIFRMSDRGGASVNITHMPQFDNFDPRWSKDGSRVAFVSDRGADEDGRNNFDIWVLDMAHPDKPARATTNGSFDDSPAWDPTGKYIYFRSNRGGTWGIWKAAVK